MTKRTPRRPRRSDQSLDKKREKLLGEWAVAATPLDRADAALRALKSLPPEQDRDSRIDESARELLAIARTYLD